MSEDDPCAADDAIDGPDRERERRYDEAAEEEETMPTYREALLPVVGAAALREAEARVYDRRAPNDTPGEYLCRDGFCARGSSARALDRSPGRAPHFPCADDVARYDLYGHTVWRAARRIIEANDRGDRATPGALTRSLDSPLREG